nr:predicted protein [Mycena chlorophos]
MGQHVWLLLATVATEILVIIKWTSSPHSGIPPLMSASKVVKMGWVVGGLALVVYPSAKFGVPGVRRWVRGKKDKAARRKAGKIE